MKTVSSKYQWIYSDDVKKFHFVCENCSKFLRLLNPKAELQAVFVTYIESAQRGFSHSQPFVLKVKCLLPNFGLSSFSAKDILCQNKKLKSKVVTISLDWSPPGAQRLVI